ncbi:MAG: hypothetical protein R3D59_13955 [Paracoccaceae bacterium]
MTTSKSIRNGASVTSILVAACLMAPAAQATEGYFAFLGHSLVQRSLSGAGWRTARSYVVDDQPGGLANSATRCAWRRVLHAGARL